MRSLIIFVAALLACRSRTNADERHAEPIQRLEPATSDDGRRRNSLLDDTVVIAGGSFVGRELRCDDGKAKPQYESGALGQETQQQLRSYRISREPTTCDEWNACVDAGGCQSTGRQMTCGERAVTVKLSQAIGFCASVGGALPTYAQWQRAIRGVKGHRYPMGPSWDASIACQRRDMEEGSYRRCAYASEDGVQYALENPSVLEWTSDVNCFKDPKTGKWFTVPLAVDLAQPQWLDQLILFPGANDVGEFRCVTETQPEPSAPDKRSNGKPLPG